MQNWLRCDRLILLVFFSLVTEYSLANEYSATVVAGKTELIGNLYQFNADIEFKLSPTAKEALQKGIALTWVVIIKVQQKAAFWDTTLQKKKIKYQIQNHALMNQYSVKKNSSEIPIMYSSLTAALDYISKIRHLAIIKKQFIHQDRSYQVAVKVKFDREALPIPLRPFSYFYPQWSLSSDWTLWPLVK